MGDNKKLCVRRFDSIRELESFYNEFEKKIYSYDIKVIPVERSKPNFLLSIEYL